MTFPLTSRCSRSWQRWMQQSQVVAVAAGARWTDSRQVATLRTRMCSR